MYGSEFCAFSFWWIIPIAMMVLCFLVMCGRRGAMMSDFGCCGSNWQPVKGRSSSLDILDRRYASGEIEKDEYEEKKRALAGSVGSKTEREEPPTGGV